MIGTQTSFQARIGVEKYKNLAREATIEAWREATKLVKASALRRAPRAVVHRTSRTYPGGRRYTGEKRISETIYGRVKRTGTIFDPTKVLAFVKARVGYSVFVEFGSSNKRRTIPGVFFMRKALDVNVGNIVRILQGEWKKIDSKMHESKMIGPIGRDQ